MKHFLQKIKSAMLALLATVISLPLAPLLTWQNAFADGATYKLESVGVGGAVPDSEGESYNAVIMNMSNETTNESVANAYCIELNVNTGVGQGGYKLADWATSGILN